MGLMDRVLTLLFGGAQNVVKDTVEVFRENAEAGAQRRTGVQTHAMAQFGAEFLVARQGRFDRFMDGLNRLPRPALALGTLGLFVSAMVHPLWFAERMQGIALVPEPLWWLLGVVVSFYFGARHQVKAQQFQREIAGTMALVPQVLENLDQVAQFKSSQTSDASQTPGAAEPGRDAVVIQQSIAPDHNAALEAWRQSRA